MFLDLIAQIGLYFNHGFFPNKQRGAVGNAQDGDSLSGQKVSILKIPGNSVEILW